MTYTADKDICRDAEGNIVDCDRPQGAFVLVVKGGHLTDAEARRYGLVQEEAPEEKAVKAAPQDKAVKSSANKAAAKDTK